MGNKYLLINSLQAGGAERQAISLLEFINFDQVFLIIPQIDYPINYKIQFLSFIKRVKTPAHLLFCFIYSSFIFPSKIARYSTVISFLEYANFINILAKYFKPHKSIVNIQIIPSVQYKKKRYWFHNLLIKKLYPKADKICCNSILIKEDLIQNYRIPPENIKVIYNSYDLDEIEKKSMDQLNTVELSIFTKYPVLINAARLNENKAHWNLIRVFNELHKTNSMLKLVILGKGELKTFLSDLSNSLGLRTFIYDTDQIISENYDVYLWGFTQNPFKLIRHAEWFVFSSLLEGMPNSVIESIICGTPVISSDCLSGPREILSVDIKPATSSMEFAQYGILMPVFEGTLLKAEAQLTPMELYWSDTLGKVILNKELRYHYHKQSLKRKVDFDYLEKIEDWSNLIEKFI